MGPAAATDGHCKLAVLTLDWNLAAGCPVVHLLAPSGPVNGPTGTGAPLFCFVDILAQHKCPHPEKDPFRTANTGQAACGPDVSSLVGETGDGVSQAKAEGGGRPYVARGERQAARHQTSLISLLPKCRSVVLRKIVEFWLPVNVC